MITLTPSLLQSAMPRATAPKIAEWTEPLRDAMDAYGMSTIQRQAGLLASTRNETGDLHATKEISYYNTPYDHCVRVFGARMPPRDVWEGWRAQGREKFYELSFDHLYSDVLFPRLGLGNTQPGDGSRYVGRGVGITGRALYKECGDAIGADLIGNPDLLLRAKYAAPTICYLWRRVGNNERMDRGRAYAAFVALNPGGESIPGFFDPHMAFYRHVFGVLVQASVLAAGFDPNGIDGVIGNGTRGALHAFQEARGLDATGMPDAAALAALEAV